MAPSAAKTKGGWGVAAGLIALSLIPAIAGGARLSELAHGAQVTAENARFFTSPLPVVLHVLAVIPFTLLGALQFVGGFRRASPTWHRLVGRVLVLCGLVAGLSGLWMAHFYALPPTDGRLLYAFRLIFGSGMVVSIALAFAAIRRRDIAAHRAWMTRGYAIGMGAGTQAVIHLPWLLAVGHMPDVLTRGLLMGAGWVINLAVAEWSLGMGTRFRTAYRSGRLEATSS